MAGTWGFLALWVGVPILVATIVVVIMVRGRRGVSTGVLSRVEEWIVALAGTGALLVAAGSLSGMVTGAVRTFDSDPTRVDGFDLVNATVPEFTEKSDAIVDAGYETAWLEIANLPEGARWGLYLEDALPSLATFAIAVAVVWLAVALLRGRPFVRSLPNIVGVAAIAVLIGGLGSQVMGAISRGAIVEYLDPRLITGGDAGDGPYEGTVGFSLSLDLASIGWALGLALVAAALQFGTRLQRDTEGLV